MIKDLISSRKTALIVNECQAGLFDPDMSMFPDLARAVAERQLVPRIAKLADAFRKAGLPVIFTPAAHRTDFMGVAPNSLISSLALKTRKMTFGSVEVEPAKGLEPHPEDYVVTRQAGLIAMLGTELDAALRRMDVQTIVLTGVSTNLAIPGNTFAAVEMGYYVIVPEDCIASPDPNVHRTIVDNQLRLLARVTTSDEIVAALG